MSEYTRQMEDNLWDKWSEYDDLKNYTDYNSLLEFLNNENFRTFGEGLSNIVQRKMPNGSKLSPMQFLQTAYKKKGITSPALNTLKGWFNSNIRPKKGENSREKIFEIAFALELSSEETNELFQKVYLDRAFDYRNPKELIFAYCIDRKLTYLNAIDLIGKLEPWSNVQNDDKVIGHIDIIRTR